MKQLTRILIVYMFVINADCSSVERGKKTSSESNIFESDDDNTHYHHHYMRNTTLFALPTNTTDTFRPKTGEIMVKDSLVYSKKPGTHQLRRQLWPIMEETMQTIAHGMATGAKILKHMVRPNLIVTGDPKYYNRKSKAVTIKNVYLGHTSPLLHKRQTKPFKLPGPTIIVSEKRPVRTTTDDYVLRFNADDASAYKVRTKPINSNPFTNIGVTGYKNFEKTVLRELEKKEERKVEASMLLPDKSVEEQLLDGTPFADWKPMISSNPPIPPPTQKPHVVSVLHTKTIGMEVKPVHENVDEAPKQGPNHIISGLSKTRSSKYTLRKPSRPTVVATVAPTVATTKVMSTTERTVLDVPNYPDFYIKQNKHLTTKPTSFAKFSEEDLLLSSGSYRQNEASPSNHRPVFAEPTEQRATTVSVSSEKPRRANRNRMREPIPLSETDFDVPVTKKTPSATSTTGRGRVKFGDRPESV